MSITFFDGNISTLFTRIQDPVQSLANSFGMTSKLERSCIGLVWDYHLEDTRKPNTEYNQARAYIESHDFISEAKNLFDHYKADYKLNKTQEQRAFLTLLLFGDIVGGIDDLPDEIFDDPMSKMLWRLHSNEGELIRFDDAKTPEESLVFDLAILIRLKYKIFNHSHNTASRNTAELDKYYAAQIMHAKSPTESNLCNECVQLSHQLYTLLRGVHRGKKPALIK